MINRRAILQSLIAAPIGLLLGFETGQLVKAWNKVVKPSVPQPPDCQVSEQAIWTYISVESRDEAEALGEKYFAKVVDGECFKNYRCVVLSPAMAKTQFEGQYVCWNWGTKSDNAGMKVWLKWGRLDKRFERPPRQPKKWRTYETVWVKNQPLPMVRETTYDV